MVVVVVTAKGYKFGREQLPGETFEVADDDTASWYWPVDASKRDAYLALRQRQAEERAERVGAVQRADQIRALAAIAKAVPQVMAIPQATHVDAPTNPGPDTLSGIQAASKPAVKDPQTLSEAGPKSQVQHGKR
ncbi:MAG: hypothetical protein AB7K86_08600 [Rhodospirillales bacterium]